MFSGTSSSDALARHYEGRGLMLAETGPIYIPAVTLASVKLSAESSEALLFSPLHPFNALFESTEGKGRRCIKPLCLSFCTVRLWRGGKAAVHGLFSITPRTPGVPWNPSLRTLGFANETQLGKAHQTGSPSSPLFINTGEMQRGAHISYCVVFEDPHPLSSPPPPPGLSACLLILPTTCSLCLSRLIRWLQASFSLASVPPSAIWGQQ